VLFSALSLSLFCFACLSFCFLCRIHRVLVFLSIVSFLVFSVLLYFSMNLMRSDLVDGFERISRLERSANVQVEKLLGKSFDWATVSESSRSLAQTERDRVMGIRDDYLESIARTNSIRNRFPEMILAPLWGIDSWPMPNGVTSDDQSDYQTMFAQHPGAVAAPTAGLHFTPALAAQLTAKNVSIVEITLHVGAGTFLPVMVDKIVDHKMHAEWGSISSEAASVIQTAQQSGHRIIAVGTTSLRILEACFQQHGKIQAFAAETDIFIVPGFKFGVVDALLTNFHLPKSTLLMLISAFCGMRNVRAAYQHAIAANYRFFSYGDACFMQRAAYPDIVTSLRSRTKK